MKKILVVDDDPDVLIQLTALFKSRGYEVFTARDGMQGLAAFKSEKPDLMILDLLMPTMDGLSMLKELEDYRWSNYWNTPVLLLSQVKEASCHRSYELEAALQLNAADYVEKPVSANILLERAERLISKKETD